MFLLRLIWAVVHALLVKRADLIAENLASANSSSSVGFATPIHHSTNAGFVVGTQVIEPDLVSDRDR